MACPRTMEGANKMDPITRHTVMMVTIVGVNLRAKANMKTVIDTAYNK
jgi:hypothetical protein